MTWLTLFGLLHAYLFWYGDILFYYGICGFVVVWFRRLPAWGLILLGVFLIAIASAVSIVAGATLPYWPEEQIEEMNREMWAPPPERLEDETRAYQGGWLDQMEFRVPSSIGMQTGAFLFWGFWRCSGMMLLGMALFKLRIFDASRGRLLYLMFVLAGLVVGVPTVLYGVKWNISNDFSLESFFVGGQFNYWGGIFIALAWVGSVMLFYKWAHPSPLSRRLESTGRMALTNYLLMTIICTTIFYGHGFGLFGKVKRIEQLVVVVAIWVFLLILSPIWLRRFLYGPFEWIWRCLSYWKMFPFVRRAETTAGS
jgi:uncharacterized protein